MTTKGNKQDNINQHTMEKAIEISSKNGMRYQFVEWTLFRTLVETYAWYNGRWNRIGRNFDSFEAAVEWVRELDRQHEARMNAPKVAVVMPQSAYYSITGYYGD